MGRKLKYKTKEEKILAARMHSKNYYERNKERVKEKRMSRYWTKKESEGSK